MKKLTKTFLYLLLAVFVVSCNSTNNKKPSLIGMWGIQSVSVGDKTMTPNARWMQFNEDSTQVSGNGWLQHSIGTWSFTNNLLTVTNTNGIEDLFPPFEVTFLNDSMIWERVEEGMNVKVVLARINQLPQTQGDKAFGLWKSKSNSTEKELFNAVSTNSSLFLRWDKRFVLQSDSGRVSGIYNTHAHKPEIEFIPYGNMPRSFWKIDVQPTLLTLTKLNSDSVVQLEFERTRKF